MSNADIRKQRIPAHPSVLSFDRPRRIADACGRNQLRRDLCLTAAKISQEIPGREPIICGPAFEATACTSAAAANTAMRV
jgi:hypothetical protein